MKGAGFGIQKGGTRKGGGFGRWRDAGFDAQKDDVRKGGGFGAQNSRGFGKPIEFYTIISFTISYCAIEFYSIVLGCTKWMNEFYLFFSFISKISMFRQ